MNPTAHAMAQFSAVDLYTSAGTLEKFTVVTNRLYVPDGKTPAVLYCHGSGGDGISNITYPDAIPTVVGATTFQTHGIYRLGQRIAEAGYPVLSGDFGGVSTWGNAICVARMEAARLWLQGPPFYAKPGPLILVGASMGSTSVLNYYRTYPGNVSCAVRAIPLSDLDHMRTYNDGDSTNAGFRAWINAAWGVASNSTVGYPTQVTGPAWSAATSYNPFDVVTRLGVVYHSTAPAGSNINLAPESNPTKWLAIPAATAQVTLPGIGNPQLHLTDLATLPDLVYYAADDMVIYPPSVLACSAATLTKEAHAISGFGGHTDATMDAIDMTRVLSFLAQYAPLPTGEPV